MYQSAKLLTLTIIPFPPLFSSSFSHLLLFFPAIPHSSLSSPFLILKEDEVREEVEKLHEERNMLLETIEDLKQTVEQTVTAPELDTKVINS